MTPNSNLDPNSNFGLKLETGSSISFDIAVTPQTDTKFRLAIFDASAGVNKDSLNETISRIKFSVNISQWTG